MQKQQKQEYQDQVDRVFDIEYVKEGAERLGYLVNFKTSSIMDEDLIERTVLLTYFVEPNGNWFKSVICYEPYFFIACKIEYMKDMAYYLERKFEKKISNIQIVEKIDLEMPNHLSGKLSKFIKLSFRTINDLMNVRNTIKAKFDRNTKHQNQNQPLNIVIESVKEEKISDMLEVVTDMREYDVPYHSRVCIDLDIRAALWYKIAFKNNCIDQSRIIKVEDKKDRPDLKILAFDIETSKQPLKFPDANFDNIMMISLMYEGDAYLITNRQICGQDVEGFEYDPKPEFECSVEIYNEKTEKELLDRFFTIIEDYKPLIITSYNGDQFDWPFIEKRAQQHGLSIEQRLGLFHEEELQYYYGRYITHLDCFHWVERDAYLPQGSHGLKAVTRAKLGYDPIEVDPEEMVPMARKNTQQLAEYSISDAVATYFLYKKHIHDFIYALCTIIPMFSDEVLRKGSGTLCEHLLMAEAYKRQIIFQNKKKEEVEKFTQPGNHLLDNETYIGGKVECLRSGVYRSDIPTRFCLDPDIYKQLILKVDSLIDFVARIEHSTTVSEIANYEEARATLVDKLSKLRDVPTPYAYDTFPLIYHLDVAAMYPNIILTNRLQPVAVVNDEICGSCLYGNNPQNDCQRLLEWQWHGEYFPLSRNEYWSVKRSLENEFMAKQQSIPNNNIEGNQLKSFYDQPPEVQKMQIKQRVKMYCQKTYKRVHDSETTLKQNTICQRENSFYIDTVRMFRDRRYQFKGLTKQYKDKADEMKKKGENEKAQEARDLSALYESLQLAHKIILNSFYGYVMRKGARWYSMEMAAMVTHIGSSIISDAKGFVDKVGKPLELDTDGIWCLLPQGFPENIPITFKNGKKAKIEYPCSILNQIIYEKFCNKQYQTILNDEASNNNKTQYQASSVIPAYKKSVEMSIFFEIDGPYKAMVIPAAREEGKLLKKRYVVFNHQNKIQELKGFEIKRRGELKIIKIFQSEIFDQFLKGTSLEQCYQACSDVASKWMDLLNKQGQGLEDEELIEYIGEQKVLSKELKEYGEQKGVGITSAKRLGEFLGDEIVKGKGLNCNFVISKKPLGSPVAERSIPISIFNAEEGIRKKFLKKWLKEQQGDDNQLELKSILDWDYYKERLANTIQKIIIIPAAMQGVKSILPDIPRPDWLNKVIREQDDKFQQRNLMQFYQKKEKAQIMKEHKALTIEKPDTGNLFIKTPLKIDDDIHCEEHKIQTNQEDNLKKQQQQVSKKTVSNSFDMDNQFKCWLKEQKKIWREEKQQKMEERKYGKGNQGKNILKSLLHNKEDVILKSTWEILQITPDQNRRGAYKIWFYTLESKQIHSVIINIPRVIYVNNIKEVQILQNNQQQKPYKLVKKRLPREKVCHFLYEIAMPEEEFIMQYDGFDHYLSNPEIEGLYEVEQPLDFKFIMAVGNMVKLLHNSKKIIPEITKSATTNHNIQPKQQLSLANIFQFENINGVFDSQKPYLQDIELQVIYIAQIKTGGLGRGFQGKHGIQHEILQDVWCIFNVQIQEFIILLVHRNSDMKKYGKHVKNSFIQFNVEQCFPNLNLNELKIWTENIKTNSNALQFIESYLNTVRDNFRGQPPIIVFQTHYSLAMLKSNGVKSIHEKYPAMILEPIFNNQTQYSSLDWIVKGIRDIVAACCQMPQQLQDLKQLCNYSKIPLCNFFYCDNESKTVEGGDQVNFMTDIIFCRLLRQMNCLAWYNQFNKQNVRQSNEYRLLIASDYLPTEIVRPGLYNSYCVEIDILCFAVNTISQSDELKNLDQEVSQLIDIRKNNNAPNKGAKKSNDYKNAGNNVGKSQVHDNDAIKEGNSNKKNQSQTKKDQKFEQIQLDEDNVDEVTIAKTAFKCVKIMVKGLLDDVHNQYNNQSDILIQNIYRWIVSGESKFYDPYLSRMLTKLMRKVFGILINALQQRQAQIIYASMSKIIINTGKHSYAEAKNYTDFILRYTNKQIQLFNDLAFNPIAYYSILLFKDTFNFSGIQVTATEIEANQQTNREISECNDQKQFPDPQQLDDQMKLIDYKENHSSNKMNTNDEKEKIVQIDDHQNNITQNPHNHTQKGEQQIIEEVQDKTETKHVNQQQINDKNGINCNQLNEEKQAKKIIYQKDYIHNWHITQFIPGRMKEEFRLLILDYVNQIHLIKEKARRGGYSLEIEQKDTQMIDEQKQNIETQQLSQNNQQTSSKSTIPQELMDEIVRKESMKYVQKKIADKLYDYLPFLEKEYRNLQLEIDKWNKERQQSIEEQFQDLEIQNSNEKLGSGSKNSSKKKNDNFEDSYVDDYDDDQYQEDDDEDDDGFVVHDENDADDEINQAYDQYSEEEGRGRFRQKCKQKDFMKKGKMLEIQNKQWEYPSQIGRAFESGDCIVELINYAMHALSLDSNIKDDIRVIKKNCCAILQLSEFQKETQYEEPCLHLKIQDFSCKYCFYVQELDIFRDNWACSQCQSNYDLFYIENKITQFVNDNIISYQLQDLYCKKCKMVKEDYILKSCQCAGQYYLQVDAISNPLFNKFDYLITNLNLLAHKFKFNLLSSALEMAAR